MNRHLRASFKNSRRFLTAFREQWPKIQFRTCIFDYFWIPPVWAAQRWGVALVAQIFPVLAQEYGVEHFWLPNCEPMVEMVREYLCIDKCVKYFVYWNLGYGFCVVDSVE